MEASNNTTPKEALIEQGKTMLGALRAHEKNVEVFFETIPNMIRPGEENEGLNILSPMLFTKNFVGLAKHCADVRAVSKAIESVIGSDELLDAVLHQGPNRCEIFGLSLVAHDLEKLTKHEDFAGRHALTVLHQLASTRLEIAKLQAGDAKLRVASDTLGETMDDTENDTDVLYYDHSGPDLGPIFESID
jgi:hypothetical protein